MKKTISGFTCSSAQKLLLNAGAVFANYDITSDTFENAVLAGKCLGATKGGSVFAATPTIRNTEIDGAMSGGKGLINIDGWAVTLTANMIELSAETFKNALGAAAKTDSLENDKYYSIKAKNFFEDSDYFDNIAWLGTLSGSNEPVIIMLYSAISTTGINMTMADKAEGVVPITFTATLDPCGGTQNLDFAPFEIFYPKAIAAPTINPINSSATSVGGTGLVGAEILVSGGTILANTKTTVTAGGTWTVAITAQVAGVEINAVQTLNGKTSLPATVIVS